MFEVYVSKKAHKYLGELPEKLRNRIRDALFYLKENPVPVKEFDVKKLADFGSGYRIRIGHFRIQYEVDWTKKEINVAKIEWRDETTYKR